MELLGRLGLEPDTFRSRVAVVTGAASGVGEQVARGLAHLGAHVVLVDILETGAEVAANIRGNSRSAVFEQVDLCDLHALDQFQHKILKEHGQVDILVNNAAKLRVGFFQDISVEEWDELLQTTVRASAFLIQAVLPRMRENGFGVIANTVAMEALTHGAYLASAMAGQKSMVLSLAGELGDDSGVSAFGFAPGIVDTPLVRNNRSRFPSLWGMSQEEFMDKFVHNPGYDGPGYEGLVPAEHCGASYVYCLAHARAYHGQVADIYHPLMNHGIISLDDREPALPQSAGQENSAIWQLNDYITGVATTNRNLEQRIVERTRELKTTNQELAVQKRLVEEVSTKLARYLPQQVYKSIFDGEFDAEIRSERKHLTIFFSDMRNFTPKTERLEPEALSAILNAYFSAMTEIARAHGATIDKFIGDAIMAFFGDPETLGNEEDASRCVNMAVEMQRRMASLQPEFTKFGLMEPLEIRVGINSGYCTVGNFGSYDRLDYTIIGTPVNIAARLQEACRWR